MATPSREIRIYCDDATCPSTRRGRHRGKEIWVDSLSTGVRLKRFVNGDFESEPTVIVKRSSRQLIGADGEVGAVLRPKEWRTVRVGDGHVKVILQCHRCGLKASPREETLRNLADALLEAGLKEVPLSLVVAKLSTNNT